MIQLLLFVLRSMLIYLSIWKDKKPLRLIPERLFVLFFSYNDKYTFSLVKPYAGKPQYGQHLETIALGNENENTVPQMLHNRFSQ